MDKSLVQAAADCSVGTQVQAGSPLGTVEGSMIGLRLTGASGPSFAAFAA